jgi:hypothetical protein
MPPTLIPTREKIRKRIVEAELLEELSQKVEEQGQVVVNIVYPPQQYEYALRVWGSTFLFSKSSDHKSKLLHAENISIAPVWTEVAPFVTFTFTLFFEGLPKDVLMFDLIESIPQPGGFLYQGIVRNEMDVYWLKGE